MIKALSATLTALSLSLALSGASAAAEPSGPSGPAAPGQVIAEVGGEQITFQDATTMLNSSAVVGVSVPAIGTPERDAARITILDKLISANLLYLDALEKGLDEDPAYRRALDEFSRGMLATVYVQRRVAGDIGVSDEQVQAFHRENVAAGTELSEDLRLQIRSVLKKRKLQERLQQLAAQLREGLKIVVREDAIAPAGDDTRTDDTPVAEIDGEPVTWGEVKTQVMAAGKGAVALDALAMESEARLKALNAAIDKRLMARKARAAGLHQSPVYRSRVAEFRKTRLINLHRARLAAEVEPSGQELRAYYQANRNRFFVPEQRKVQEVVLETREQAQAIKDKLQAHELSFYEAAQRHSIAPGAGQHLGEIGWVAEGRAVPAMDQVLFELGPDELGGPVSTPAGWHIVRVLDVQDPRHEDIDDRDTATHVRRRYIHDKLDAYVVGLRRNRFPVTVHERKLTRLAQQEADMVKQLAERSAQPGSRTEQRAKELGRLLEQPAP